MKRTRPNAWPALAVAVLAAALAGCNASDPAGNENPADSDGAATESTDDDLDTEGSTGAGGWQPPALEDDAPISPVPRLTRTEYVRTVEAALPISAPPVSSLPNDGDDGIFLSNATEAFGDFSGYVDVAQLVGEQLASELVDACTWASTPSPCLETQLDRDLGSLLRRDLSVEEHDDLVTLFETVLAQTEDVESALSSVVLSVLLDDRFLFHLERGLEPGPTDESLYLSGEELAERLSYFAHDGPPGAALAAAAASGTLVGDELIRAHLVDTLLDDPRARDKAWEFGASWLQLPDAPADAGEPGEPEKPEDPEEPEDPEDPDPPTEPVDECNTTAECIDTHGAAATDCANSGADDSVCMCGAQPCMQQRRGVHGLRTHRSPAAAVPPELASSMYEETRRFMDYVLLSGEVPMQDLFTANYSFIDATLAEHYGVPAPSVDWERYEFPVEARRKGIFTHASFLANNGSDHRDVAWIFRGKIVLERLFCYEFPPPPDGALEMEVEDREAAPQCAGCHQLMDPVGRMFDTYDELGALRTEGIQSGGLAVASDIDGDYEDVLDFLDALGESRALTRCMTQMMYRHALGREAVLDDGDSFETVWARLEAGEFEGARAALLTSESFATVYIPPAEQICE